MPAQGLPRPEAGFVPGSGLIASMPERGSRALPIQTNDTGNRLGSLYRCQSGFSMIEIVIVVALMAFVYMVAIPQFSLRTGAEAASKMNQLAGDIRSAYDMAVLSGKTYRMVFNFASGEYWLEDADRSNIYIGNAKLDRDPTAAEEKEERLDFDARFQEYVDQAGRAVVNPETDKEISAISPVLQARSKLSPPVWTPVSNMEWDKRSLGPYLMIQDMQVEHHGNKQTFSELGEQARGMLYFFPSGYVQRAVIHVAYKKDDMVIDESQEPYTLTTNPYEGTAEVQAGYIEVNVHEDPEA